MWPTKAKLVIISICIEKTGYDQQKFMNYINWPLIESEKNEIIKHHLFIYVIITVGYGFKVDFIYAWKSGKNPSANSDKNNKNNPINSVFL